jgi:hypothetical protein
VHWDDDAPLVGGAIIDGMAAPLTIEHEADRLAMRTTSRALTDGGWGMLCGDGDFELLDHDILDWQRFAMWRGLFDCHIAAG